mmetsp:Transcript_22270/g.32402  ORF Transcript_22270/g.32402 Transcript_22270/m.32402 type:complete len:94 (-) Transcript_22270:1071-1352(-)
MLYDHHNARRYDSDCNIYSPGVSFSIAISNTAVPTSVCKIHSKGIPLSPPIPYIAPMQAPAVFALEQLQPPATIFLRTPSTKEELYRVVNIAP